nr:K385 [uncultured bacterium]
MEERFVILHTSDAKKVLLNKNPTGLLANNKPSCDPKKPQKKVVQDGATIYLKQLLV